MKVSLIVAMDTHQGIGKNNDLMWHLPADMKFFKETTTGHVVVMGRKNWDSIPAKFRPLPNRENVVLTRNTTFSGTECIVFHSLETCLSHYKNEEERTIFIIGGGEIYRYALEIECVDEMYITHVEERFNADTFFPRFEASEWTSDVIFSCKKDAKNEASFTIRHYVKK